MVSRRTCPECGTAFTDTMAELCPQCLLQVGLQETTLETGTDSESPTIAPARASHSEDKTLDSRQNLRDNGGAPAIAAPRAAIPLPACHRDVLSIPLTGCQTSMYDFRYW